MRRVVTALVAAAVAVPVVLLLSSRAFFWVCLALFWSVGVEYAALARRVAPAARRWVFLVVYPAVAAMWTVAGDGGMTALVALAAAPLLYALVSLGSGDDPGTATTVLGWWSFGTPYLALPLWAFYELHLLDPRLLLLLLLSVWLNDVAAFYVGSRWGRHKLAPRLSPKKTVEGSVAGLVAATLVGGLGTLWLDPPDAVALVGLVVVSAVAAQGGDLVESTLKRSAGVKDSGQLLPGHGGLLDRMDAIILAAPVFYGLSALLDARLLS